MKNKSRHLLKTPLKIAFVGGLFWILYQKGLISKDATLRAFTHLDLLLPAMGALFLTSFLGVIRWKWLLEAQGIPLGFAQVLQLTFIGNFFNIPRPGAVSGDFVKAFYVSNSVQGQRARAFGSILFDRVVGLSALVLVSAGALALDIDLIRGTPLLKAIQTLLTLAAATVVAFYSYLFLMREHHDPLLGFLRRLEQAFPRAGALPRIYEGIRHYHHHRWTVVRALAASVMIHVTVGFACTLYLRSLEVQGIPVLPVFIVVPLGLLVTAVPVAPAGVGTGHYAFGELFRLLGTDRGADLFSLYALTQLTIGGVGGLVYLRYKSHAPKPDLSGPEDATAGIGA